MREKITVRRTFWPVVVFVFRFSCPAVTVSLLVVVAGDVERVGELGASASATPLLVGELVEKEGSENRKPHSQVVAVFRFLRPQCAHVFIVVFDAA